MLTLLPGKPTAREVAQMAIEAASRDPIARLRRERAGLDIPDVPAGLADDTKARLLGVAVARTMTNGG